MSELMKRVLLIINPRAGKNSKRANAYDIVKCFPANYKVTTEFTRCTGDATRIVKEQAKDHDIVVCCGGDGTFNETVNGVMEMPNRIPVGYIPMGSTNDLAATIGLPLDYKKAVDLIVDGHMNWYDIGLFNNRYFTYTASFGAFTRSSYNTSQRMKNLFGHSAYIANGVFSELKNLENFKAKIECDQGVFEGEFCFGSITNSSSVAGIFRVKEEEVKLDDGVFELLLVSKFRNFAQVPALLAQMRRKEYDGKQIMLFHTSKFKITFEKDVAWTVDGEYGGTHTNVITHNLEKAIRVFSPPGIFFNADKSTDVEFVEEEEKTEDAKEVKEKKEKRDKKEFFQRKKKETVAEEAVDEILEKAEEGKKAEEVNI